MSNARQRKIEAILKAGKEQLPPEEYEHLLYLIDQMQAYGVTNQINCELGMLMSRLEWELPSELQNREYSEAVIAADGKYLGTELKEMYRDMGLSPGRRAKKEMIEDLYKLGQPEIVDFIDSYIGENEEEEGEENG